MNIIEELFYRNIAPNLKTHELDSTYGKAVSTAAENEEKLLKLLDGKERALLIELIDAEDDINGTETTTRFVDGFRLGARFILDTFVIDKQNILLDIT